MKNEVVKYHPSYTDEENIRMHEVIENSFDEELVELITELQKLYIANVPSIYEPFQQLKKEICERDLLSQKYEKLKECANEWRKYETALILYKDADFIRKEYAAYNKDGKKRNVLKYFIASHSCKYPHHTEELIKKAVLSEKSKRHIGMPQIPYIYHSLDEVIIEPMSWEDNTCLMSLGTETLKYIIRQMLWNIDSPRANEIPAMIIMNTRKYSQTNHKKKGTQPIFSTTQLSIRDLKEKCSNLLSDINDLQEQCQKLLEEIQK